jgi:hypothetical protein
MRLPSFMKINAYNRFEFKPRYYDARKERLEQIKAKYNNEDSTEAVKERIRGTFDRKLAQSRRKSSNKSSSARTVLIFVVLVAIAYYFLR